MTNSITQEYYVGIRSCDCLPENDNYLGSGIRIMRSIKKHGKSVFKKDILQTFSSRKEASLFESFIVNEELLKDELCLNLKTGGEYIFDVKYAKEVGRKISKSVKCFYEIQENRDKQSLALKKYYIDNPEMRKHLSEQRKLVAKNIKHKEKVSKLRKKAWEDPLFRQKMIEALTTPTILEIKSKKMTAYAATDDGQAKLSNAAKNTTYMNDGSITKRIKNELVNDYIKAGWTIGSLLLVSKNTREKISKNSCNRKWIYSDILRLNKRVKIDDIDSYITNGWKFGYRKW